MNRHLGLRLCLLLVVLLACRWGAASDYDHEPRVRIGLTPVFLDDQLALLESWRDYLQRRLGHRVDFVQRTSYREVTELLLRGELDFAWICGFPYVRHQSEMALVAIPLYNDSPLYQSYLIVSQDDHETATWGDLAGGVFAFSDPDSNSGYLYPRIAMFRKGIYPDRFFRKTFFSWGHRNVVEAVAVGLADAGAVDGYVWEALSRVRPDLTQGTRVVAKSPWFGFPPIVAGKGADARLVGDMQRVLLAMEDDADGRRILDALSLDGFTEAQSGVYDSIARMAQEFRESDRHAR